MKQNKPFYTEIGGLGCSSSGDDLLKIAQTFRTAVRNGLVGRTRTANGIHFRIQYAPETFIAVKEFVLREKKCCPFFNFEVTQRDSELLLRIEGPKKAEPLLNLLFQLAEPTLPQT